jgi:undecaprenyl-diphosphatase
MDFLYSIDLLIFKFVNQITANTLFDFLMPLITDLHLNRWFAIPVVAALLGYYIFRFRKRSGIYFLFLLLAIGLSDFSGGRIKRLAERPRPFQTSETLAVQRSPASMNTSFYSNHASNNFTFATYSSLLFPQGKIFYLSIATLISYSRVYNGVHYPSDIFTGALAGILWGTLFQFLVTKLISTFKKENV